MRKLLLVLLLVPVLVHAQGDTVHVKQWDFVRGVDGVVHTFTMPARWQGKDWVKVGGIIASTAALTLLDEPVYNYLKPRHSKFLDGVERVGYHYGKSYSAAAVTGGFYLVGVVFKNEWAKETGLMLATALTTSTVIQAFLKSAVGRARPISGLDHFDTKPFSKYAKYHSMPSGHTTLAFTISLVMARQVESVPVKIFFYSLAGITGASRLYTEAHWISDVAMGGTIAWFCADAAVRRLQANQFRKVARENKFCIKLYPYPGGLSLRATW